MQGIWTAKWLQPTGSGQRDDAGGPGTIWQNGPRGLSDKALPPPLPNGPLAPSYGVPLHAP